MTFHRNFVRPQDLNLAYIIDSVLILLTNSLTLPVLEDFLRLNPLLVSAIPKIGQNEILKITFENEESWIIFFSLKCHFRMTFPDSAPILGFRRFVLTVQVH